MGLPRKIMPINIKNINAEGKKVRRIILSWYLLAVLKILL